MGRLSFQVEFSFEEICFATKIRVGVKAQGHATAELWTFPPDLIKYLGCPTDHRKYFRRVGHLGRHAWTLPLSHFSISSLFSTAFSKDLRYKRECYDLSPGQSYYFQLPSISWHIYDFEKLRLSGGRSIDSGWKFIVKDYERVIRRFISVFILYNISPRYVRRIYINKSSYLASDVCIDAQTEIVSSILRNYIMYKLRKYLLELFNTR